MPCVMYVGIHIWTWWMAGLSAAAGARAAELAHTDWDRGQGTGYLGSYTPVAENSGARQSSSRAVACLVHTVMVKLDDARAATTAKTTPGREPEKRRVFAEAHQSAGRRRVAGSNAFLELDRGRSS